MSVELTKKQVRDRFLNPVRALVPYWDSIETKSSREKLDGLAFSIMSALDGSAMALPRFVVAPAPHPDDKQYHIERGEDYYPEAPELDSDISGCLHELYHRS